MSSLRPIIYTPSGRAGEYTNKGRACNIFCRCSHRCRYCYVVTLPGRSRESYFGPAQAVPDALARLERDCQKQYEEPIFFSFIGDPFPTSFRSPDDNITRRAIEIVKASGNHVRLLTKGCIPEADMTLLGTGDEVGVTLTCKTDSDRALWEPEAATNDDRLRNLHRAQERGCKRWVSFEPVLQSSGTLMLIEKVAWEVGRDVVCKVGCSNHLESWDWPSEEWRARVTSIDWRRFALDAKALCERLRITYYLKADLRAYLPEDMRSKLEAPNAG